MTQLSQLFKDGNVRMARLMRSIEGANKPDIEIIAAMQREAEIHVKALNAVVALYSVQSKNKRAIFGLEKMNLMDDSTAVDLMLEDPETDKIKCPLRDDLITRAECLDYSGSNGEDCQGCSIGRATKAKLLPPVGSQA